MKKVSFALAVLLIAQVAQAGFIFSIRHSEQVAQPGLGFTTTRTIYLDNFSGLQTDPLNGTAPDIQPGIVTWTARELDPLHARDPRADGSIEGGAGAASGSLSFTFESNRVYVLTVDVTITNPSPSYDTWAGISFNTQSTTNGILQNSSDFAYLTVRRNGGAQAATRGTGGSAAVNVAAGTYGARNKLTIIIDTTLAQWKADFLINDVFVATKRNIAGAITAGTAYISIGQQTSASVKFENLKLTVFGFELPDVFPINKGFFPLLAEPHEPNYEFDTLENAGRFAMHHGNVGRMDEIKNTYSNVVMTIAVNPRWADGENRNPGVTTAATGEVWPGFWLFRAGSKLTSSINTTTTTIPVQDASRFTTADYASIFSLDGSGIPNVLASTNASNYEYVDVTGVDTNNNTLTVVRGRTGTAARSFTANQAAVSPFVHGWTINNKITQFRPNFSLVAPRHPVTGENAAEFWARGRGNAILAGLNDGYQGDVITCLAGANADVNLDLEPDAGFIDGRNVWSLGWQEYSRMIREIIGPDRIINWDCVRASAGYRGWKYVNGVQLETFGSGVEFSQNFDLLEQWVQYAEAKPAFSYGYCREPTTTYGGVQPDNDWMFRKQFAAGIMVGMPHPYGSGANTGLFDWDEQRGGMLTNYTWLGRAKGPYQRDFSGLGTTNLLAGGSWVVQTDSGFKCNHENDIYGPQGIRINVTKVQNNPSIAEPVYAGVRVQWNSTAVNLTRGAEYTLVFDAKATDTTTYGGTTYGGTPGFVRIRNHKGTIERLNLLVPVEWRTYYMTYTVPESGGSATFNASFQLGEEAGRSFWIRNPRLYTGTADRFKREFENGMVLLNESLVQDWTLDVGSSYKRRTGDSRPDIHDGSLVDGNLTVPSRDAVYLLRR